LKRRELIGIQIGGRAQWRIERAKLEEFIARAYHDTARELLDPTRVEDDRELTEEP
jgi:hypothetical protein